MVRKLVHSPNEPGSNHNASESLMGLRRFICWIDWDSVPLVLPLSCQGELGSSSIDSVTDSLQITQYRPSEARGTRSRCESPSSISGTQAVASCVWFAE